jgi:RHS repeat-associated protein
MLQFLATGEGRITKRGGKYNYEYHLKDHLGNSHVGFDAEALLQADNYYPFGVVRPKQLLDGERNKYLYNSKELQEEAHIYDYGARMYDPVLGKWNGIDPLADQFYFTSPYTYAVNNPLSYIDPDGMKPVKILGNGTVAEKSQVYQGLELLKTIPFARQQIEEMEKSDKDIFIRVEPGHSVTMPRVVEDALPKGVEIIDKKAQWEKNRDVSIAGDICC